VTWSYLGMLVAMASMINRSAPWPETTFPLRSRAPALIGAQVGEDRAAIWGVDQLVMGEQVNSSGPPRKASLRSSSRTHSSAAEDAALA